VKLPIANTAVDKPSSADQTIIAIGANRAMYVNAKQVPESDLANRVRELLESKNEKVVIIKADQEVEYGAVMAAMDQLRQVGVEDIGLITERPPQEGGAR
jgi:biopolymer transport protein ExbD